MDRSSFVLSSIAFAGAAGLPGPASAQAALMNLRVSATANDSYASSYFAQDAGFFTKNGLNVDLQTMNNGPAIAAAVSAGTTDIGVATPVTLANAYLHGLPVTIVAAGAISTVKFATVVLTVAKNSPLAAAKDFEGKIIALNALRTGSEVNLDVWLTAGGADLAKVKIVEMNFSDMGPSLQRGRIDGAVMTEPAITVALQNGQVQVLTDLVRSIASEYVNSCWFAMRAWATANPEPVRRFQHAIYDAQKWANAHHAETAEILAHYSKMDLTLARQMTRSAWAENMKLVDIQTYLDAAAKFGMIPKPIDAAALVYKA